MGIVDNALIGASGQGGYFLSRSLRTRAVASAYLNRTFSTSGTGAGRTWTFSAWIKRGALGSSSGVFDAYNTSGPSTDSIGFRSDDTFTIYFANAGGGNLTTTQVFRDPSAWYHIVIALDTTQATASNRCKIYVNGSQVTAFGTANYPSQNAIFNWGNTQANNIGRKASAVEYFDGYLAEVNFIDGQALTASSFGSTNTLTGVWQPARYTGTYGTNGFYLPFTDNSALTTSSNAGLGKDFSGNGNYWTTNNISITAGTTYDSMTDVPTLTSATAANFAVLNRLFNTPNEVGLSSGNLNYFVGASSTPVITATIGVSSGKWYWEVTATSSNNMLGIISPSGTASMTYVGSTSTSYGYYFTGVKYNNASATAYGASYTTNDVIGVALDLDAGTLTFYKNGTSQGTAFSGLTGTFFPACGNNGAAGNCVFNFGQRPFAYTPPTGFVSLNTFNLPTSTIVKGNTVMDATLWTGNGATQSIVNAAPFRPDLVWIKIRSAVGSHRLLDSVRGATNTLASNLTNAEFVDSTGLTAFNSNGFTLGADGSYNGSGSTYVGWQWQAGQGTTSTNTSGTITSTVSVNASAGFSVVTFTGNGLTSSGQTIGHGLGVTPAFIITKKRSSGTTDYGWSSWHKDLGGNYGIWLNQTSARNGGMWAGYTNINSSVFSPPDLNYCNESGQTYVAYCWAPIAGYSSFGSYVGNGSTDGPFIYTGFKPRYIMMKDISAAGSWIIQDSARNPYNPSDTFLQANTNIADYTYSGANIDFVSNGFKIRGTDGDRNFSGYTYIYYAFAENPFKNSLAE